MLNSIYLGLEEVIEIYNVYMFKCHNVVAGPQRISQSDVSSHQEIFSWAKGPARVFWLDQ